MTSLFTSDADLLRHLRRTAVPRGGSVAILAGHFTVVFDPDQGRLVPLIRQEPLSPPMRELARSVAGDFPVASFRLGARFLHACALSSSAEARLLLLVDDVSFSSPALLPEAAPLAPGRDEQLRRDFLAGPDAVPSTYVRILNAEGMQVQDALLPRNGVLLHSEHDLGACFRQTATPPAGAGFLSQLVLETSRRKITDLIFLVPAIWNGTLNRGLELAQGQALPPPDIHLVQHLDGGSRPVAVTTRRGKDAISRPDLLRTG